MIVDATRHLRPPEPRLATLVIIASVAPLAMNVFLPSLPGMARYFHTEYAVMQLLVSLYLVALAIVQLVIGPASDRFGRRPIILASFVIFCIATLLAIFAWNFHMLLACRILQCSSAAGIVLSRAIVRDTVDTEDAASRIGYITMGMSVTPMVAPFIGGYLDELYSWKASFWLTFAFGAVAFLICYFDLRETNLARSSSIAEQFRSYPQLFRARLFWGYTATATGASGMFFAFLGGGPYISTEMLHMSPSQYGLHFSIVSIGYMLGNFLSGRFSRRWGMNKMMLAGNLIGTVAMVLSLVLFAVGYMHPLSLFGSAALVGIGNGMTLPNANAGMVSVKPHLAGSASGLGGALTMAGGAAMATLASALLSVETGPYPLVIVCLVSGIASVVSALFVLRYARWPAPL